MGLGSWERRGTGCQIQSEAIILQRLGGRVGNGNPKGGLGAGRVPSTSNHSGQVGEVRMEPWLLQSELQGQFSLLQLPGTRSTKSSKQQRNRLCLYDSRLPYVLAFPLVLWGNEMAWALSGCSWNIRRAYPVVQIKCLCLSHSFWLVSQCLPHFPSKNFVV